MPDIDAVILDMQAKNDNIELKKAKELHLPIYFFPKYIYKESIGKTCIVAGNSLGKTTTTSRIMHVLKMAQKKFDYLEGAQLEGFNR